MSANISANMRASMRALAALVLLGLSSLAGCGSSPPEVDPKTVAACEDACDTFAGGDCYGACKQACSDDTCMQSYDPSDFEGVTSLACSESGSISIFNGDSSLNCTFEGEPGGNGTGTQKRVFVTATSFGANMKMQGGGATGLEGADNICTNAAKAASLGGTWKAWLSDSTASAIDRIGDVGPWLNVPRTSIVIPNKATLTQSPPASTWSDLTTEAGDTPMTGNVWTGTANGGHVATFNDKLATCGDWTDDMSDLVNGWTGAVGTNVSSWTDSIPQQCAFLSFPLYCFEQ